MDSKVKLFYDCYMEELKRKALILMDYSNLLFDTWLYHSKKLLELVIEGEEIYLKYDDNTTCIYLNKRVLLSDNFEEDIKKLKKWNV